jgi:hypothetical protein
MTDALDLLLLLLGFVVVLGIPTGAAVWLRGRRPC